MMNLNQEAVQNIKISYCVKWKCLNLIVAGHLEVLVLHLPSPRGNHFAVMLRYILGHKVVRYTSIF